MEEEVGRILYLTLPVLFTVPVGNRTELWPLWGSGLKGTMRGSQLLLSRQETIFLYAE